MVVYRKLRLERMRIVRKLGRRGMLLILFGIAWILVGVTAIIIPQDRFSSPGIGPDEFLQILDGPEINLGWVIAGGISLTVGCLHDRRIVSAHEALGWNAMLTMPLVWAASFAWSFVVWIVSDGEGGRSNSLYGCIVWLVVSLIIMFMAGWPEQEFAVLVKKESESDEVEE